VARACGFGQSDGNRAAGRRLYAASRSLNDCDLGASFRRIKSGNESEEREEKRSGSGA
jgi:hypothetical protein